jgi:catechol 2,3-dioxygenase-like lactoylglutathione lyase family enzyme
VIDHVSLQVRDYRRSKDFYVQALAPLGFELVMEFEGRVGGFARDGKPWFWIREGEASGGVHVAFQAADTDAVEAFHASALEGGGTDNGLPGLRDYHPGYYAAYVLDPDRNNIEAVYHGRAQG